MTHEYAPADDTDIEVVGLLTFPALAAMTGLAKDGDQAPDTKAHIEHARMPVCALKLLEQLETWVGHRSCNLHEAVGQYSGPYDDLDARTRPSIWSERPVKTYVTLGTVGDPLREVNKRHGLFSTNPDVWNPNQKDWECDHLALQADEDPQLAVHLSLWACRVAGEILGLVCVILFTHPALAREPNAADEVVVLVTKRHNEQMAQTNLKA